MALTEIFLINRKKDTSWSKTTRNPDRILDKDAEQITEEEFLNHQEKKRAERQKIAEEQALEAASQRKKDVLELVGLGLSVGAANRLFDVSLPSDEKQETPADKKQETPADEVAEQRKEG